MLRIQHTLIILFISITLCEINCDNNDIENEFRKALRILKRARDENVIGNSSLGASSRTKRWMTFEKIKTPSGKTVSITSPKIHRKKCGERAKFVRLYKDGRMSRKEYKIVSSEVDATKTAGCIQILKIRKVSNSCLWDRYKSRRDDVMTESNVNDTNERLLFYGRDVWNITTVGFDERLSPGGSFGAGIYFTDKFSVADADAVKYDCPSCPRKVLLNRVILGKEFKAIGSKVYAHAPVGHDSVVGKQAGHPHDDYVVYRVEQAYPEYVITYKTCE